MTVRAPDMPRQTAIVRLLGGIADAFGDANFRRYSVGSIVSWLSFYVQAVAVAWTAWSLTHSTRWLAAVALLDAVPMSLLAPLGGVLADRYDRFRILIASYAVATVQAAALAVLAATGHLTIAWLAVLALAHGLIHAFSVPSQFGLLPRFVAKARLPAAISVAAAYTQLGLFVGPALAGWVLLRFGPATAFASNVVGYGIYLAAAARLRTPPDYVEPVAPRRAMGRDLAEGIRIMTGHSGIVGLSALMVAGNALLAAQRQMLPAYADRILHAGVGNMSTLLAAQGVGATVSALWLAQAGARRTTISTITTAFAGYLAGLAALLATSTLVGAAAAMLVQGFAFEICRTGTLALLQISVPDQMRGRLMSTQFLLQQGAAALGVAAIGIVADDWGIRAPLLGGVGLAFAVWLLAWRRRSRMAAAFVAELP